MYVGGLVPASQRHAEHQGPVPRAGQGRAWLGACVCPIRGAGAGDLFKIQGPASSASSSLPLPDAGGHFYDTSNVCVSLMRLQGFTPSECSARSLVLEACQPYHPCAPPLTPYMSLQAGRPNQHQSIYESMAEQLSKG